MESERSSLTCALVTQIVAIDAPLNPLKIAWGEP